MIFRRRKLKKKKLLKPAGRRLQREVRRRWQKSRLTEQEKPRLKLSKEVKVGQKVNPIGLRLGIVKTWDSKWFVEKGYGDLLLEDIKIRKFIKKSLPFAAISKIVIERTLNKVKVNLHSARPGIIIGRRGSEVDRLREDLENITNKDIFINIVEIKRPALDAQLVAENVAQQLLKRVAFRRAMKRAVQQTMEAGAGGIKIGCAGRLGGAEIARSEWYREGRVPLHTFRADIGYGVAEAKTTYGLIGIKVWIFSKEILPGTEEEEQAEKEKAEKKPAGRGRRDFPGRAKSGAPGPREEKHRPEARKEEKLGAKEEVKKEEKPGAKEEVKKEEKLGVKEEVKEEVKTEVKGAEKKEAKKPKKVHKEEKAKNEETKGTSSEAKGEKEGSSDSSGKDKE